MADEMDWRQASRPVQNPPEGGEDGAQRADGRPQERGLEWPEEWPEARLEVDDGIWQGGLPPESDGETWAAGGGISGAGLASKGGEDVG